MDQHVQVWKMKKINDMELAEREVAVSNILRYEEVQRGIYLGCAERIVKSLFMVNSGGVVAVLTYLHPPNNMAPIKELSLLSSLKFFLVGLLCAFILVACDYLVVSYRISNFNKQCAQFFNNSSIFSNIKAFQSSSFEDEYLEKMVYWLFVYGAGAVSFSCAIFGITIGVNGYFL